MKTPITLVLVLLASIAPAALGQGWPLPAKTPDTEVVCNTTGCEDPRYSGKKLHPYSDPIKTFVGRFVDSTANRAYQFTFRTARARVMKIDLTNHRIYLALGSAIAAYDTRTFFSRLENNEPLMFASSAPVTPANSCGSWDSPRHGACFNFEVFLRWDRYFYAENGQASACMHKLSDPPGTRRCPWVTKAGDGDIRLFSFDYDDRGYVYPATGAFGWGIVKDDVSAGAPELMATMYQHFPPVTNVDDPDPNRMIVVKSGSNYYAITGGDYRTNVWNVTNVSSPTRHKNRETSGFLSNYAKNADGSRIAVITINQQLQIYTPSELVNLGTPLMTLGGVNSVTSDGVNFFASTVAAGKLVIHVITPGGAVIPHVTAMGAKDGAILTYGAGYLTASGYDTVYTGQDVRLFALKGATPVEVPLNGYVAKHYTNPPNGHTSPEYQLVHPAHVFKSGSKYYLILNNFGLGDVYEIKGADSIAPKIKASGRTKNPFSAAPALPANTAYYGDEVTFTTESTVVPPPSVTWHFGDGTSFLAPSGTPDTVHQYGGLLPADLPKTYAVTAANAADPAATESVSLTLAKPEARVRVVDGATPLFALAAGDNTALPIVSSDEFVDASFGAVEGHYSEWRLVNEGSPIKQLPTQKFSVGPVGLHTLDFTAHYGPYTGTPPAIVSTGTDAQFAFGVHYRVRPFAVTVNEPAQRGANVEFTAAARATRVAGDLTGGDQAAVKYTWDLVRPDGAGGWVSTGTTKSGTATLAALAGPNHEFTVPRTAFQGADGWKVLLVTTLVNSGSVSDPQNATVTAERGPLHGPLPGGIEKSGCDTVGAPCSFRTPSSRPGIDPAAWDYVWSVPGTSLTSTAKVFQPAFTVPGNYTVNVKVSNALGDAVLSFGLFEVGASLCSSAPTENNTTISIFGLTSSCFADAACAVNESIRFTLTPIGWTPGECDQYTWNFGDGTPAATGARVVTHSYSAAGDYTVTLTIDGGASDATITRTVRVGSGGGCQPNCPGPCPTIVPGTNVYASVIGITSFCTSTSANNCVAGEDVSFQALSRNGYSFSCGPHTFTWNFGDNHTGTDRSVLHKYAADGTYNGTVVVNNGAQTATIPFTVRVGNGSETGDDCKEMISNGNVAIGFAGAQSNCSAASGVCRPQENITFLVSTTDYSFSCAPHTFSWNFGDGTTSNLQNPAKVYAADGTYKVTLTITNPEQSLTMERNVAVSANNCPAMVPDFNVFISFAGAKSNCSSAGGNCVQDEDVTFTAKAFQYNYNCAPHAFTWEFGDGTTATGPTVTHQYTRSGTVEVKLRINNGAQEVIASETFTVAPTAPTKRRGVRH